MLDRFPFEPTAPGEGLQPSAEAPEPDYTAHANRPRDDLRPTRVHLGPWLAAAFVVLVIAAAVIAVVSLRDEVEPVEEARDVPGIDTVDDQLEAAASGSELSGAFQPLPDMRQLSSREAINYIKLLNAPYVVIGIFDDSPVGTVLEQSPAAGVNPPQDAVITLVISRGVRPGSAADASTQAESGG